jgi:hypothetical protein
LTPLVLHSSIGETGEEGPEIDGAKLLNLLPIHHPEKCSFVFSQAVWLDLHAHKLTDTET